MVNNRNLLPFLIEQSAEYAECVEFLNITRKLFITLSSSCRVHFARHCYCSSISVTGDELYDKIYNRFDQHRAMQVNLETWATGLSVLLRGNLQEKLDFCWKVKTPIVFTSYPSVFNEVSDQ